MAHDVGVLGGKQGKTSFDKALEKSSQGVVDFLFQERKGLLTTPVFGESGRCRSLSPIRGYSEPYMHVGPGESSCPRTLGLPARNEESRGFNGIGSIGLFLVAV